MLSACYGAEIWLHDVQVEVDGVTGICFLGLRTYGSAIQLFIPVLFGYVLCLLTGLYLRRRSEGIALFRESLPDYDPF